MCATVNFVYTENGEKEVFVCTSWVLLLLGIQSVILTKSDCLNLSVAPKIRRGRAKCLKTKLICNKIILLRTSAFSAH